VGDAWADYQRIFKADESVDGKADPPIDSFLGNFKQLKELKAKYPKLQVLMSLGGGTWSAKLSDAARTPASRSKSVASCIDEFIKGDLETNPGDSSSVVAGLGAGVFDGIDLDWQYPAWPGNTGNVYRPEDTANYTALLAEFRRQLEMPMVRRRTSTTCSRRRCPRARSWHRRFKLRRSLGTSTGRT